MKLFVAQIPSDQNQKALFFLRLSIGLLTIIHGAPKIMGGTESWQFFGAAMTSIGIDFLPVMWGFIAAATEFFGGIMFTCGLGTRFSSFFLALMMAIATIWHVQKGDLFMVYSFPLSVMCVFITFLWIGGGRFSLDYYSRAKKLQ